MNPEQSGAIVKQVLGAYPAQRQRMSADDVIGLTVSWVQELADVDEPAGKRALSRLLRSSRFLPTIAEFREACVDGGAGGGRKNGGQAWGEIVALIRRYGSHRVPGRDFQIADPLVEQVIRAMHWPELCVSENAVADRARCIELYDQLATAARKEAAIAPGAGVKQLPNGAPRGIRELVAEILPDGDSPC